jgi:hypothetical protein
MSSFTRFRSGIFAVLLLTLSSDALAINEAAWKLDEEARVALEAGNHKKAESLWLQAYKLGEKRGFEYASNPAFKLAEMYALQKRSGEAEKMFLEAKRISNIDYPDSGRLQQQIDLALGKMYLETGKIEQASVTLTRACTNWMKGAAQKEQPSSTDSLNLAETLASLSTVLANRKQFAESQSLAKSVVSLLDRMDDKKFYQAEKAKYQCFLGKMACRNRDYKTAIESLSRGLKALDQKFTLVDWERAEPSHYLVLALTGTKQDAQAKELSSAMMPSWPSYAFEQSDEWSVPFAKSMETSGDYHREKDQYARDAVAIATKWGTKDVRFADSEARLGIVLHHKGKYDEAPPHMERAIMSLRSAAGISPNAAALRYEHWGKLLEDTSHYTRSAPWSVYRAAVKIRKANAKYHDEDAFRGAKQIANYCKNGLASSYDEELFSMFADACDVMATAHGLNDERVLDAFHDLITAREQRYQYEGNPQIHAPLIMLYRKVLTGEKDAYGATSPEVKETASNLVAYLRKVKMNEEADLIAKEYAIK